ncbi:MAG: DUF1015 domain-containing protein [Candidatus Heimdallarchaeota archaeon]|nr:DUF1015 domain-containing protein [Candidatus Heimdallarchaeota archaeon]MCG3257006.1 DUF1015 domain-containing protein [Candidatus Heimdallarchaeota archaeon]MCK4612069.1 DUF1015 domain-containing protein [Candidatus Heimdallarchaeota archaeon]
MVDIKPFKAIRYTEKAGDIEKLVVQPYDKINAEMQFAYYTLSDYNYCRLTLPIEENRYEVARQRLELWLAEGILEKEEIPGIYVYYQEYELFGKQYIRKGFIGALRLHPFNENIVLPHEKTHSGPKIDRLNMLKTTRHTLETGFILYSDPEKKTINLFDEIAKEEPLIKVKDDLGVLNRIWKITNPGQIKIVQDAFAEQQLVIADGHHRYETAITYRDMRREEAGVINENAAPEFRMTYLVPVEDEGLVILATHRCLAKVTVTEDKMNELKMFFDMDEIMKSEIPKFLGENKDKHVFVMYQDSRAISLIMKDISAINRYVSDVSEEYKNLDVVILRDMIFHGIMGLEELHIDDDIFYERWWNEAVEEVDKGTYKVAFILNPTAADEVLKVSKNHERMPQKATDFYPKMISGFTMLSLEEGEKIL